MNTQTNRKPTGERRRQILDEAIRIVGRRGYYGFSVQEVAESCGLTVAGVLHHFGTKEKLLIALLEDRDRRDAEAVRGGRPPGDPIEVLHDIVVRNSTQPELIRLYTVLRSEALYQEHPAYDYFRTRDQRALDWFAQLAAGRGGDPRSTARQLLALMGGLEEQWLRFPGEVDLVAEWDRAVTRIL
ncbi:TetR/AcrR family transcriptional regulator [Streptosporangiaceae bacterium NEAU-GS5]|nr:TetR/AcrR family transcriptional regulator [Streptosporangiaceae bacterium NEAU-GS5]